jgi:hypothetical protein
MILLGDGTFGRRLGHESRDRIDEIKELSKNFLASFAMSEHRNQLSSMN